MKKVKTRKKKIEKSKSGFPKIVVIACIFLTAFFVYKALMIHTKTVVETPRTEMKKIPKDVLENLKNQRKSYASFRVPILLYHYVEYVTDKKDTIRQSLDIEPNTLDSQIKTLKDAGYNFITAGDLAKVIDGKATLPKKPIILTFDDGHWDLDTNVLPILKKYNVKATAYIISGFIGGSDFLTSAQLNDVIKSNLVEIGAHTVHHVGLAGESLSEVKYEVEESKKELEEGYNVKVVSFAYPAGRFDQQAIDVVKNAGFSTAVSTIPGVAQSNLNRYFLYRLRPGYRRGQELLDYLNGNSFRAF